MHIKWEECRIGDEKGARILRIYSRDSEAELPETVENPEGESLPVLELADYAFPQCGRNQRMKTSWDCRL